MATILQRAIRGIESSGFSNAKKIADLAIKRNVDSNGNPLAKGYEEAINVLSQFQFSENESEALDAQRLIQGYTNTLAKLESKKRETNRTVGEFKVAEREAFYVTPTTQFRSDVMFDFPELVADTVEELRQLDLALSNAIDEKRAQGENTGELENYHFDFFQRYRAMEELYNDLLNEEITPEQALNNYGVYVDADQVDGEIYGIMIAPVGNLPSGLNVSDYQRLQSSAGFGGANIPVFSRFSLDEVGQLNARIGNRVWVGEKNFPLAYDSRKSGDRKYRDEPGAFKLEEFAQKKSSPIRPGKFFKGFTGFNESGNPVESMFFASPDGNVYTIDDETKDMLAPDFKDAMAKAVGVDSQFAKNVLQSENVKPLNFTPVLGEPSSFVPPTPTQPQQEEPAPRASFFDRTNRPNRPEQPAGTSFSTPDIIETGKSFFRKVGSFFQSGGVRSNQ
jgi:hypothetical protein